MSEVSRLLEEWRADLAGWAIPDHISAAVKESPWVLPRQVFARRADRLRETPSGVSHDRAWAALDPPGSVLDVGAGAGAACLPLLARATGLAVVDSDSGMLELLAERAQAQGVAAQCFHGNWPEVAAHVPAADVVTCHHVLYNVPDLGPFVAELTRHARRLVVAELTACHPLVTLNGLWLKFHGVRRPDSPAADDLVWILAGMGLEPGHERWTRPGARDYASFEELTEITRRRLCLPPERAAEVAEALAAGGSGQEGPGQGGPGQGGPGQDWQPGPAELASSGREVVTVWWRGTAG
ncbi:MAG: class I SAM-dependent methyltransferase [Streptosporangiaceae bacterium]